MIDHAAAAKEAFNSTWDLIDKRDRTPEDDRTMLAAALASWHHWRQVGEAKNFSISDWQVSRVLALVGEPRLAADFAASSLDWAEKGALDAFYVAYAHEAAARAAAIAGDATAREAHLAAARGLLEAISDDDRQALVADLETI